jgi:nucleoid-associated protein YgaU
VVTVAGAAATVLVVLSLTAGPTLIRCFGDAQGVGACLRDEVIDRGLLPPDPPRPPAIAEGPVDGLPTSSATDAEGPAEASAADTGQTPAGQPGLIAAPAISADADDQQPAPEPMRVAGSVTAGGRDVQWQASVTGALAISVPLASASVGGRALASATAPVLGSAGGTIALPPLPLSFATLEGRAQGAAPLLAGSRIAGAAMLPPRLSRARVVGVAALDAQDDGAAIVRVRGTSALLVPLARVVSAGRLAAIAQPSEPLRASAAGAAKLPMRLAALGAAAGETARPVPPVRVALASSVRMPEPLSAGGRAEAAASLSPSTIAAGRAELPPRPTLGAAVGSIAGRVPREAIQSAEAGAITLPQRPPPPLSPAAGNPSQPTPAATDAAPLPRVMQMSPQAPVPAERQLPPLAQPPGPVPAIRNPAIGHPMAPAPVPATRAQPAEPEAAPVPATRMPQPEAPLPPAQAPAPLPPQQPAPQQPMVAPVEIQRRIAETYSVVRGDTLWAISRRAYGAGRHYPAIFAANSSLIEDPDLIYPGQVLNIPDRYDP